MRLPDHSQAPRLRLYVRDGCHLCEEALAMIDGMRSELPPFELEVIDIEADEGLHATYVERIPVAELGGAPVFELIPDRPALVEALAPSGTL